MKDLNMASLCPPPYQKRQPVASLIFFVKIYYENNMNFDFVEQQAKNFNNIRQNLPKIY